MHTLEIAVLGIVVVMSGACREFFPPVVEDNHNQQQQTIPDSVASIEIRPAGVSVAAGSHTQFTAILKNAAGQLLNGHAVTWSTANAVATVASDGMATANEPGSTTVTASSEGKTASTSLSVTVARDSIPADSIPKDSVPKDSLPADPLPTWANEPGGLGTISDNPLDALNAAGWGTSWNEAGWIAPAMDGERGPVIRWNYPTGFTGGRGPGMEYLYHASAKEAFAGFWFKASDPWQSHPSLVNKMAFWYTSSGQYMYIQMYGEPPYRMDAATSYAGGITWLPANQARSPMIPGAWHRIEWHAKYATSSSSGDGIIEWWLDGVLQGRYANIQTPADEGFAQFQISPTWGGFGGVKNEDDYYQYDDMHLSGR